jgi:O-methyltransferase
MKTPEELYLDLLKQCLTRALFPERYERLRPSNPLKRLLYASISSALDRDRLAVVHEARFDPDARAEGRDWPLEAETMIGLRRLDNIQFCATDVMKRDIPGDLLEAGTWRGGATILMRAVLKAYGDTQRRVWVADSFEGVPHVDPRYPADRDDTLAGQLAVSLEEVKENFRRYDLLDEQVEFLPGWFRETLPNAPVNQLALLRLDGDMYESTIVTLRSLYPRLSPGGYVIVDDYDWEGEGETGVKVAIDDFRSESRITDELQKVDWNCVFWRRSSKDRGLAR